MSNVGTNIICVKCADNEDGELILNEDYDSHFYVSGPLSGREIDGLISWLAVHREHGEIIAEPEW